jgi:exopolysaccharide production protein ExoQ
MRMTRTATPPPDASRTPKVEATIAILIIVFLAGGFVWLYGNIDPLDRRGLSDNNPTYTALSALAYTYAGIQLYAQRAPLRNFLIILFPLFAFIAACFASTAWSVAPLETFVRAGSLLGTVLFALYLVVRFPPRNLIIILGISFILMTFAAIILSIGFPYYGRQQLGDNMGNWRGIYSHKNDAAYTTILALVTCTFLSIREKRKAIWLIGVLSSIIMLIGSASRTSLVVILVAFLFGIWMFLVTNRKAIIRFFSIIYLLLILLLVFFIMSSLEFLLSVVGRDATLTGRMLIWPIAVDYWKESPVLGHGYQAAYLTLDGMPSRLAQQGWVWIPAHSHNCYLDILLGVGVLGLGIYAYALFQTYRNGIDLIRLQRTPEIVWGLLILICISAVGVSGRVIMQPNTLELVLTTIAFYLVAHRQRHVKGDAVGGEGRNRTSCRARRSLVRR